MGFDNVRYFLIFVLNYVNIKTLPHKVFLCDNEETCYSKD